MSEIEMLNKINELQDQLRDIAEDQYMIDLEINTLCEKIKMLEMKKDKLQQRFDYKNHQMGNFIEEFERRYKGN